MKSIIITMSIVLLSFSHVDAQKVYHRSVKAQFISNYDGGTIKVNIPSWPAIIGNAISVRIYGIDTPELKDRRKAVRNAALFAKAAVNRLCKKSRYLVLKNVRRDKYFRLLADVYVNNKSIAKILISKKLAKPYRGGKKRTW